MIITNVEKIDDINVEQFAWSGLSFFKNPAFVAGKIALLHNCKIDKNVRKQAEQIRFCITLAEEYKTAAKNSSMATKPLFLYYSCMHLVLAEILLKQDGMSSLDKARGEHRHHGLIFSTSLTNETEFKIAGMQINASPMIVDGNHKGTFELWHRSARHLPLVGKQVTQFSESKLVNECISILHEEDSQMKKLKQKGVNILDCYLNIPFMYNILKNSNILSTIERGTIIRNIFPEKKYSETKFIIHPNNRNQVLNNFDLHPSWINYMNFTDVHSGLIMKVRHDEYSEGLKAKFPNGFNINNEEIFFFPTELLLNELGYIYVSLFMLSNLCRYYPDIWIHHIENHTPLALFSEYFLKHASEKMALLSYSELQRTYFVKC